MKKILFAVMFVAVFSFAVMAQDARTPVTSLSQSGRAAHGTGGGQWGLPPAAGTILFYGGDINPNDPNADGFANGNTLLVPTTYTYGAVTAPKTGKVTTSAIFFNDLVTGSGPTYVDPATGTYDVRTGVTEGSGGKDLASGSGAQTSAATGRTAFGYPEYTTTVKFAKALTAAAGTTYWLNESPQCTNGNNSSCTEQYFFSNTTQETNGVNASAQPSSQLYFESAYFGFTWANWCDSSLGLPSGACARGSFGLLK